MTEGVRFSMLVHCYMLQEADACGARIEYMDQEQSVTVQRISENFKFTVCLPALQAQQLERSPPTR